MRYREQRPCRDGRLEGTKYTAIMRRRARPILNFQKQDAKKLEKKGRRARQQRLEILREETWLKISGARNDAIRSQQNPLSHACFSCFSCGVSPLFLSLCFSLWLHNCHRRSRRDQVYFCDFRQETLAILTAIPPPSPEEQEGRKLVAARESARWRSDERMPDRRPSPIYS